MSPLEFDHAYRARALRLRQGLNKFAQCCNFSRMRIREDLGPYLYELSESTKRLQASTARLARCMESHGYE
jgi:hypothetical protein